MNSTTIIQYFGTWRAIARKLAVLGLIIGLFSCEDVVDVELNDEDINLISVEAYLSTSIRNSIIVKLERTLPVTDPNTNPAIHNAHVEIYDDSPAVNKVILNEVGLTGIYKLPQYFSYKPVPGRTYTLKITTEDNVVITGQDYLQEVGPIDDMKVNLSARGNYQFLAIYVSGQETPGPGNFYKWDIYRNGDLLYGSDRLVIASDELVDGNYIQDFEIFTDFHPPNKPEEKFLETGDSIYVIKNSISKNVYDFYYGMVNQSFSGAPFSVPPASLPSNLTSSDGKRVLGIFSARDIAVSNLVVIDSTNYTPLIPGIN